MRPLEKEIFICLDCEATGLDPENDKIIEIAAAKFDFSNVLDSLQSLIDPQTEIPQKSQEIHHISDEMVKNKPKIEDFLRQFLKFIKGHILIGHCISFDLNLIKYEAQRNRIPFDMNEFIYIDTLRLARLYGESPLNSLEILRKHFNIEEEGAHRAMNDVLVNIEVFKRLTQNFNSKEDLLKRLKSPIPLKSMPLGKHKGRKFSDIPLDYLIWAANKDFDQDLLFSIRSEIKLRKKQNRFNQASNPFSSL